MGEKKLPMYLTMPQLRAEIVDWSERTIKRKIENEDFPGFKDEGTGKYLFETKEVLLWMKRRKLKSV